MKIYSAIYTNVYAIDATHAIFIFKDDILLLSRDLIYHVNRHSFSVYIEAIG